MAETLKSGTQGLLDTRLKWLKQACDVERIVLDVLPKEIVELECKWATMDRYGDGFEIRLCPPDCEGDIEGSPLRLQWVNQTKLLIERLMGIVWDTKIGCNCYGDLYWHGVAKSGQYKFDVVISQAPKPPLCKLIEKEEVRTVKVYEAECPEEIVVV